MNYFRRKMTVNLILKSNTGAQKIINIKRYWGKGTI